MFQNAKIAREYGKTTEQELLAEGVAPAVAASLGRQAEASRLKALDEWVLANVNLD